MPDTSRRSFVAALLYVVMMLSVAPLLLPTNAQTSDTAPVQHAYEVYLEQDIAADGSDRLLFVDLLTGETTTTRVNGDRYTPLGTSVLFYQPAQRQVMLAYPDGSVQAHPFISLDDGARRVDWILSRDGRTLAWTLTYGESSTLRTMTHVASPDGANMQRVLSDGPRGGVRMLPVAFTVDNEALIMDAHPDGLGRFAPYTQYAGLFRVTIATGEIAPLPGEPSCFCAAALRAGLFLRLALTPDLTGFDVRVSPLGGENVQTIDAIKLDDYTQAGDILISPDGRRAVYALSKIDNFGAENQSVQTVFMLVNLETYQQERLTDPITTYVHPVHWTEDNTAILFTSPQRSGTWKIRLSDATLTKVAEPSYIGVLNRN